MAVKYRAEYTSSNNIDYTIDISSDNYSGAVINIVGNAVIGLNSVDDLSYPIRSKYLKLSLLATTTEDLDDLFATNEREWKVELYRGVDKIFFGYLSSEGATQSFVTEERMVDFDVLDPIAFLDDLSYVDLNGSLFTGSAQVAQIIARCLRRGFENQADAFNILSYCNYDYATRDYINNTYIQYTTGRFLKDVTLPQDNFYSEENLEPRNCQEVLSEILSCLNLRVEQVNGSTWLIGHNLYDNTDMASLYVNSFDKDGSDIADITGTYYPQIELKTDAAVNASTDIIHVNENQSYFYKRGLKKLLLNYKHEYKRELTDNSAFDNGVLNVSMPGWSVETTYAEPKTNGTIEILPSPASGNDFDFTLRSASDMVAEVNDALTVKGSFRCNGFQSIPIAGDVFTGLRFNVRAVRVSDGFISYLRFRRAGEAVWDDFSSGNTITDFAFIEGIEGQDVDFEYRIPFLPSQCYIEVEVGNIADVVSDSSTRLIIYNLGIYGSSGERVGVSYSANATNDKSIKADSIDIKYDLNESKTKSNQFYKLSIDDPITNIEDKYSGLGYYNSIGRLKGIIELIRQRRRVVFSGDFYNYLDSSSIVSINGLSSNKFIPIEYSFDTYQNVGSVKLEERFNDVISFGVTETPIYEETIKPTIE